MDVKRVMAATGILMASIFANELLIGDTRIIVLAACGTVLILVLLSPMKEGWNGPDSR